MEDKIYSYSVQNKDCVSCKRFQRDVMLTLMTNKGGQFYDFLLTNEQAEGIIKNLQKTIDHNKKKKKSFITKIVKFFNLKL